VNEPAPNVEWTDRVSGNSNLNDPRSLREIGRDSAQKAAENEQIRGVWNGIKTIIWIVIVSLWILGAQGCAGLSKWNDLTPPIASNDTDAQVKRADSGEANASGNPTDSGEANASGNPTDSGEANAEVKQAASAALSSSASPIYASPPIAFETPFSSSSSIYASPPFAFGRSAASASPISSSQPFSFGTPSTSESSIYASPPFSFEPPEASESKTKVDTQDAKTSNDEKSKRSNSEAKSGSTTHNRSLKSNRVDSKGGKSPAKDVAKSATKAGMKDDAKLAAKSKAKDDPNVKKTQTRADSNRVVSPEDPEENPDTASTSPADDVDPFLFPRLKKLIREDETQKRPDPKVNIRRPDPDTANFPNSAYTVAKGRMYIENSPVGFTGPARFSSSSYNWNYLIRYGLTDNLEFRLFGNGYTAIQGKDKTTGFAPLDFDFKAHFWNENRKFFIPAAGLEVYLQTDFGSPAFDHGVQPSINMLFDQTLFFDVNLEWNIGITGARANGNIYYEVSASWSFEHKIVKDLDIFIHGFYNAASLPRSILFNPAASNAIVNGVGLIKTVNDQFAIFGSYNLGCTKTSPNHIILAGFAVAF
jgi:hypothetical protein